LSSCVFGRRAAAIDTGLGFEAIWPKVFNFEQFWEEVFFYTICSDFQTPDPEANCELLPYLRKIRQKL
jgi:hypothetical protein